MVRIEEQATINRPVEEVFAYMSDIERQPEWVSTLTSSQKTGSGPTGVGTTYRQGVKFLGRRMEMDCEILAYEPPTLYAFRARSGPMRMEMRMTLAASGTETTLTQVAEGESNGLLKLADPIMARSMKKQFAADLESLKTLLESGIATETASS